MEFDAIRGFVRKILENSLNHSWSLQGHVYFGYNNDSFRPEMDTFGT